MGKGVYNCCDVCLHFAVKQKARLTLWLVLNKAFIKKPLSGYGFSFLLSMDEWTGTFQSCMHHVRLMWSFK